MKLFNNTSIGNTAATAEIGDTVVLVSKRDKKVLSAIGHGLLAVVNAANTVAAGAATVGFAKMAMDKQTDVDVRIVGGVCGVITGTAAVGYGSDAVSEAKKAIADAREAYELSK